MKDLLYKMIIYHNELLDEFQNFGGVLCDAYADIDDTLANDKYFEVIRKFREEGICLCCEANEYDDHWMMTKDGYVMPDDMIDEDDEAFRWKYGDDGTLN